MKVSNFISARAKDSTNNLLDQHHLLNADYYSETDQQKFDENKEYLSILNSCIKNGLHPTYYTNTVKNAIRQLYSLKQVTKMWKNTNINYDFFIYMRPDLLYINKLDTKQILENLNNDILLSPYWGKFKGLNDRIYMGNRKVITYFSERYDELKDMIESNKCKYKPEIFMKYISNKYKITIIDCNLKGKRVRTNGRIINEKF